MAKEVKKPKVKVEKKEVEKKPKETSKQKPKEFDPYKIIKFPLNTEKSIRMMESENKLLFVVDRKATKQDIKKAIEILFKAKVQNINTMISLNNTKRAFVKFKPEIMAIDIATNLGLM